MPAATTALIITGTEIGAYGGAFRPLHQISLHEGSACMWIFRRFDVPRSRGPDRDDPMTIAQKLPTEVSIIPQGPDTLVPDLLVGMRLWLFPDDEGRQLLREYARSRTRLDFRRVSQEGIDAFRTFAVQCPRPKAQVMLFGGQQSTLTNQVDALRTWWGGDMHLLLDDGWHQTVADQRQQEYEAATVDNRNEYFRREQEIRDEIADATDDIPE